MIRKITDKLTDIFNYGEAKSLAIMIMCNICGKSYTEIITHEPVLTENQTIRIEQIIERLRKKEPIQYILGETYFFGRKFKCDQRALIPRPETEELIDRIIRDNSGNKGRLKILDVGTGTGCIAITLALELKNCEVTAIDISDDAVNLTKENNQLHGCNIKCIRKDIFDLEDEEYDIIVSNPPYICDSEIVDMESNVVNYEPHIALFVSDNHPLKFYDVITAYATKNLKPGGKLYFEINQKFGNEMIELLKKFDFDNIKLIKDINNNDRIIRGEKR